MDTTSAVGGGNKRQKILAVHRTRVRKELMQEKHVPL